MRVFSLTNFHVNARLILYPLDSQIEMDTQKRLAKNTLANHNPQVPTHLVDTPSLQAQCFTSPQLPSP